MPERLLEALPGSTGPNVLARGKDVEADAVYLHELEDRNPRFEVSVEPGMAQVVVEGSGSLASSDVSSDLDEWISPRGEWKAPKRLSLLAE
jgi:hypothetical protein